MALEVGAMVSAYNQGKGPHGKPLPEDDKNQLEEQNMISSITAEMHKMIHEQLAKKPNLPSDFEARMDNLMDDTWKEVPSDDLLDVMIPVYQKHLTKGDVDVLVAFYAAPTGQKMLKEMPAMMSESMQAASGIIQKMMAKAMQRVDESRSRKASGRKDRRRQDPPAIACHAELTGEQSGQPRT
jgi:hypothetical protein